MQGSLLLVPEIERAAQIIDGQHRVAGIKAAILENAEVVKLELPVAFYKGLNTRECANIFISINTEQKPVPRSLVFDLYGIASESIVDPAAVRARDIAVSLNEDQSSPYYELVKFPGSPRTKGGIALSTVVGAIKPLIEEKGVFDQIGITELERQRQGFLNLFQAISKLYGEKWNDRSNAFLYAAGFTGAIEFLKNRIVPYCTTKKSFKSEVILDALKSLAANLVAQSEIKGLGGKDAPKRIYERLNAAFEPNQDVPSQLEI